MKKIVIGFASLVAAISISAGVYVNHSNAYSYDDIRVERVASYEGLSTSKVRFEKGYAVICEPVASGSIQVGVESVTYSRTGAKATVHLIDKSGITNYDTEAHYVTYWNIYVPVKENCQEVSVQWN